MTSLADRLACNLGNPNKNTQGSAFLVLPENSISNLFAVKFGITIPEDLEKFHQAFRLCTEGQGNELKSINNVISSALLPLLTFFRLLGEKSGFSFQIELEGQLIKFDRCFFEVRNRVLRLPSCLDVALYSSESKVMLFFESKLSEYKNVAKELRIKDGYLGLYNDEKFQEILRGGGIKKEGNKLMLADGGKAYLEGIKQTVSHLIGLVQGPSENRKGVYYPRQYLSDYKRCFEDSSRLYYATIILDPKEIGVSDEGGRYKDYVTLYQETIGDNGEGLIKCIRLWDKINAKHDKEIWILRHPLSYHTVFKANRSLLLPTVRKFYQL